MSLCVLDASAVFPWLFQDEASPEADLLLLSITLHGATVPALWHIEVANVLGLAERRGRIGPAAVTAAIALLGELPVTTAQSAPEIGNILAFMRAYRLTAYDAIYLDLVARIGLPLATADKALKTAASAAGIALMAAAA